MSEMDTVLKISFKKIKCSNVTSIIKCVSVLKLES